MSLPRGVEMMVMSLVKMIGLDPVLMMNAVDDIRKSLHSAATDMATIRRQNSAIMSHLGIAEPIGENENEQPERSLLNGNGAPGAEAGTDPGRRVGKAR